MIILRAKLKLLFIIPFVVSTNYLKGQDIHFSQYFNHPLSLSPSQTGNFEGDWRAFGNYRTQWKAIAIPFRTFSAGYDRKLFIEGHDISVGGYVLNDHSGIIGLSCNQLYISGAYHKAIEENHFTGGLQIGFVMKSVNYDKIAFPDDWDTDRNIFDPNFTTGENDKNQLSYLDVNLGLGWKRKINKFEPEAGLSFFHLNHPTNSFKGSASSKEPLRGVFHAALRTELSNNLFIKPGLMVYAMRGARNIMLGSQGGFVIPGNRVNVKEIYGGLYLRNGIADPADAIMVMFGAQVRKIVINVSYDMNVSSLRTYSNYRGAFEVSFIFKSISAIIKTFTIPCERI